VDDPGGDARGAQQGGQEPLAAFVAALAGGEHPQGVVGVAGADLVANERVERARPAARVAFGHVLHPRDERGHRRVVVGQVGHQGLADREQLVGVGPDAPLRELAGLAVELDAEAGAEREAPRRRAAPHGNAARPGLVAQPEPQAAGGEALAEDELGLARLGKRRTDRGRLSVAARRDLKLDLPEALGLLGQQRLAEDEELPREDAPARDQQHGARQGDPKPDPLGADLAPSGRDHPPRRAPGPDARRIAARRRGPHAASPMPRSHAGSAATWLGRDVSRVS